MVSSYIYRLQIHPRHKNTLILPFLTHINPSSFSRSKDMRGRSHLVVWIDIRWHQTRDGDFGRDLWQLGRGQGISGCRVRKLDRKNSVNTHINRTRSKPQPQIMNNTSSIEESKIHNIVYSIEFGRVHLWECKQRHSADL